VQTRFSNGLQSKEEELLIRQRLMLAMDAEVDQSVYQRLEKAVGATCSWPTEAR
jgi:hypothetical protein